MFVYFFGVSVGSFLEQRLEVEPKKVELEILFLYFYKETDFKYSKHGIKSAIFKHLNRAGRKKISSNKIATLYLSFSFISF